MSSLVIPFRPRESRTKRIARLEGLLRDAGQQNMQLLSLVGAMVRQWRPGGIGVVDHRVLDDVAALIREDYPEITIDESTGDTTITFPPKAPALEEVVDSPATTPGLDAGVGRGVPADQDPSDDGEWDN